MVFSPSIPLLQQLNSLGYEFDQQLYRAFTVSASKPDIRPEDNGFPDSYVTLALYRLNTVLTRVINLDETKYNLFHDYKKAPACTIEEIIPGSKLCAVLDKASKLAKPKKVIGVGHFLRAVIQMSLDEPASNYGEWALHNTFSIETLLWGLGYSAWTKLDDAPEVVSILEALDGRDPIQNHNYIMTYEGGRIVFRATSILDPYYMQEGNNDPSARLALLTHFKDQYSAFRPDEILELEDLINNPRTREQQLQTFFEENRAFFGFWKMQDVYPQVYLTHEDDGPLIPDFILVDPKLQRAMILDLKLPKKRIVVGTQNRKKYAAPVFEARSQLLRYKDWFDDKTNRMNLKDQFGIEIFRPQIGVIIGRSGDFETEFQRQQLRSDNPDLQLVTYDDILEYAKRRIVLVQKAERT